MSHQNNRSLIRSQQSYDSGDQRVTQAFRSNRGAYGRAAKSRGTYNAATDAYYPNQRNTSEDHQMYDINEQRQSPAKMKKVIESDPVFQSEMQDCLGHMEKMPGLRAKVFNQLG